MSTKAANDNAKKSRKGLVVIAAALALFSSMNSDGNADEAGIANDAAETAFRIPREQLYGKTDREVFPEQIAAHFEENDRIALASGKGMRTTEILEHEDGTQHYSLVSKFPIPGPEGTPALIGGMAIDVTDRRIAERALQESEERFR